MNLARRTLIGIPYLWLLLLFLVPFGIIFKISVLETEVLTIGNT